MNEEKYLKEKVGCENPFRVPDGYFDTLAAQVMAQIDAAPAEPKVVERKARTVWLRRPVYYAAACLCALFVSVAAYRAFSGPSEQTAPAQVVAENAPAEQELSFDEAVDYMMIDNQDIYACLADY